MHIVVTRLPLVAAMSYLLCSAAAVAHANGRLPAATALAIHPTDEREILLGLTFGLALSRDGGATWTWMCEQQIEGNGGTIDPAMVVTGDGTLVVLSLTNGGVLVSRDDGCSFERTMGLLQGQHGMDLTMDPSEPGRVLALMSTVIDSTEDTPLRYRNIVAHSRDHARSWELLAELPDDLQPQTIEVAASDPNRIYVSGTSSADKLKGIVERSDDGGLSWNRTIVQLPRGTGSMFISAIHPADADRLWVRVPGYGDIYGVLPAHLWLSTDGGVSFDQVGDTEGGMLGFAASPDGDQIVFGGPLDGFFLAPSDGSAPPTRVSDMPVSCLRWTANGLYACALESNNPFSFGLAPGPTQDFVTLWQRADTCRPTCAAPSRLELKCAAPWVEIAPMIGAETAVCDANTPPLDGGIDAGLTVSLDGGSAETDDASAMTRPAQSEHGCAVTFPNTRPHGWILLPLMVIGWRRMSNVTHRATSSSERAKTSLTE